MNTDMSAASLTDSEGSASPDSEPDSSTSLDHSHEEFGHEKLFAHRHDESVYSHTYSNNTLGDTQGSFSHGTSDASGEASEVSTVSILLRPYEEFYENANDN